MVLVQPIIPEQQMVFVVPDDILEELKCDVCLKYLSVGPVQVDNKRNKICGRCVISQTDRADSMYHFFIGHALFKCINRFDGCNALLTDNQVIEHEKTCKGKLYNCPLCNNSDKMFTFELFHHIKTQHDTNLFLRNSKLEIRFDELKRKNTFFYLKENYIFLIYLKCFSHKTEFLLNASYIGGGEKLSEFEQKFNVYADGHNVLNSENRSCLPFASISNDSNKIVVNTFAVDQLKTVSQLIIYFEFTYKNGNILFRKEFNAGQDTQVTFKRVGTRKIKIHENFMRQFQDASMSVSKTGNKLMKQFSKNDYVLIDVQCSECSNISSDNIYINTGGRDRQLICKLCASIYGKRFQLFRECCNDNNSEFILHGLRLSCVWNCSSYYDINGIKKHEIICKNAPKGNCPVEKCYFNGIFENVKEHVSDCHGLYLFDTYINVYTSSDELESDKNEISIDDEGKEELESDKNEISIDDEGKKELESDKNIISIDGERKKEFFVWLQSSTVTIVHCEITVDDPHVSFITKICGPEDKMKNILVILSTNAKYCTHFKDLYNNFKFPKNFKMSFIPSYN